MKPCNESEIVGIKSMGHSKDYYAGYDAAKKDDITIFNKIKVEIEQTADEEQKHDKKWATGLKYAVKIIDKYITKSKG